MTAARKTEMAADEWITLTEAARALGESRLTTVSRSVKGEIEARHIAGRTVVSRASVDRLLAARDSAV